MIILIVKRNQLPGIRNLQPAFRKDQLLPFNFEDVRFVFVVDDKLHGAGPVELIHVVLHLNYGGRYPPFRQLQRRHQARGARAHDHDVFFHWLLLSYTPKNISWKNRRT